MISDLYSSLCSYQNLYLAFCKARKGKTNKPYVIEFEKDLKFNLLSLQSELNSQNYHPLPLQEFIIRDPKTRKINRSAFRDRIVHHALCNIIEPFFENNFIYDSYANRKNKGTLKAIARYDYFLRIVSHNHSHQTFVLKADIKHYFENVNHDILLQILQYKIKDGKIINLIKKILKNHSKEKGMPLGNLTSQFFANVYLNQLDQFIKHTLKAKYYIRYVDDFIILDNSAHILEDYKQKISTFLCKNLALQLHSTKTKIIIANRGVDFLGIRIFPHHKLLRKKNLNKFKRKYLSIKYQYNLRKLDYDRVYDFMEGWVAYAKYVNTHKLRKKILIEFEKTFTNEISTKEINRGIKMETK